MKIADEQRWGSHLALLYAIQIDRAEAVKAELMEALQQYEEEGGTANKSWWQRIERVEKYIAAEATVNKTGPLLMALMKEFLATPASLKEVSKPKGGTSDASKEVDPVEDELAALRKQRGNTA